MSKTVRPSNWQSNIWQPDRRRKRRTSSRFVDHDLDQIIEAGGGLVRSNRREALRAALDRAVRQVELLEGIRTAKPIKAEDLEEIAKAAARLLGKLGVAIEGDPQPRLPLREELQKSGREWAEEYRAELRRMETRRLEPTEEEEWKQRCQMHGNWPSEVRPHEADLFGEGQDVALCDAVRGVQRLRTWGANAAERLRKEPPLRSLKQRLSEGERKEPPSGEWSATSWRHQSAALIGRLVLIYPKFFDRELGVSRSPTKRGDPYGPGIRFVGGVLRALGIDMKPPAIAKAINTAKSELHNGKLRRKKKA